MSIISERSLELVKATASAVASKSVEITKNFYNRMLTNNPEVLQFFNLTNQRTGRQPRALADSIVAYAVNIERLQNLSEAVERIAQKHCALNIRAEHYPIVHDNLMATIKEVFGDAINEEIAGAWSEAVMALAKILINRELELYEETQNKEGGWNGKREFEVIEKKHVANDVIQMSFKSVDGKSILSHQCGQCITVVENPIASEALYFAPRHYTLISPPGSDFYTIAPKLLHSKSSGDSSLDGKMSSYLHSLSLGDIVHLYPPFGPSAFDINEKSKEKVAIFISSGIGITPALSYLPLAIENRSKIAFFHADSSVDTHPFRDVISSIFLNAKNLTLKFIDYSYSHPPSSPVEYFSEGRLTPEKILNSLENLQIDGHQSDFYICCSEELTLQIVSSLHQSFPSSFVHYELFGPHINVN